MYKAVYNTSYFYWEILDEHGAEIDWATTKKFAEELVEKYNSEEIEKEKGK